MDSTHSTTLNEDGLSKNNSNCNTNTKDVKTEKSCESTDVNLDNTAVTEYASGIVSPETQVCEAKEEVEETSETDGGKAKGPEQTPPVRVVLKRGRRLIPSKEDESKVAPANFVDVPDYGYVGVDGSFQVPF